MGPVVVILSVLAASLVVFAIVCVALTSLIHKKMFGSRFAHDPLVTTYSTELLGLEASPIEVGLYGETVRGGLYVKKGRETDKNVIVIVCHGMWTSHKSYMQDIGYICNAGFEVIGFDYIGTSTSDGKSLGGFGQSLRSLDAVVRYVKADAELSKRRIYVYGHSWGGYAATNIVAFHPDIAGVIAVAPAASFDAVAKNSFPKGIHFLIPLAKLFDRIKTGRFANRNAVKSLAGYSGSVLIIHSEDDHMCPYATTTALVKKSHSGSNFKYLTVKDKGHNPHYTRAALNIMREYGQKLQTLASEEEKREYKKTVDFIAMGELDREIMDKVVAQIK